MSSRLRLLLASFLMLFLELSLIRWSGAEVVHLSYFSNFVLLGSFLGIGLGFLGACLVVLPKLGAGVPPLSLGVAVLGMLSMTLGNDFSGELPDAIDLSCFCLNGLGLGRPRAWHERVEVQLQLTGSDGRSIRRGLAR